MSSGPPPLPPLGDVHFVERPSDMPPCGSREGHVTTGFWDVTCDPCLHSLPLALAQFRLARQQLWAAVKLSLRSRRSRHGS